MPTSIQLRMIHVAARQVGLNDDQYRMLLRNVADAESSKNLGQADFEDVMAVLEDMGFRGTGGVSADYWRNRVQMRGDLASTRMVFKIREMAKEITVPMGALCRRHSHGRTEIPGELEPAEAYNVIEAMKDICLREGGSLSQSWDIGSEITKATAAEELPF